MKPQISSVRAKTMSITLIEEGEKLRRRIKGGRIDVNKTSAGVFTTWAHTYATLEERERGKKEGDATDGPPPNNKKNNNGEKKQTKTTPPKKHPPPPPKKNG